MVSKDVRDEVVAGEVANVIKIYNFFMYYAETFNISPPVMSAAAKLMYDNTVEGMAKIIQKDPLASQLDLRRENLKETKNMVEDMIMALTTVVDQYRALKSGEKPKDLVDEMEDKFRRDLKGDWTEAFYKKRGK